MPGTPTDDADDVTVWEFSAIVEAAAYSIHNGDAPDTGDDTFEDRVYEVYLVLARRISDSDTDTVVGTPDDDIETAVKNIASELEDGFDDSVRRKHAQLNFEVVSRIRTRRAFDNVTRYWERDDFDPYDH